MKKEGNNIIKVELDVKQHKKSETADEEPKYSVLLQGRKENLVSSEASIEIKVTLKSAEEALWKEYPLKGKASFALEVTDVQSTLE